MSSGCYFSQTVAVSWVELAQARAKLAQFLATLDVYWGQKTKHWQIFGSMKVTSNVDTYAVPTSNNVMALYFFWLSIAKLSKNLSQSPAGAELVLLSASPPTHAPIRKSTF